MSYFYDAVYPLQTPNVRFSQLHTYDQIPPIPSALPVTLAQVKEQLRLDPDDDSQDDYLTLLINASSEFFEKYTGRVLITKTYRTYFDIFRQSFELVRSKLQVLNSFEYLVSGSFVAVDASIYYVTQENNYSRIIINQFDDLPTDKDDQYQSIKVEFSAGYGNAAADIPADIQLALLNQIAALYENRGDCNNCDCSDISNLPTAAQNTYRQYRILSLYSSNYRG